MVDRYIEHYNNERLNSAIGYIAPLAKLEGRDKQIFEDRDRKLETARESRKVRRRQLRLIERTKEEDLLVNLN